jgi:hypothetical protein
MAIKKFSDILDNDGALDRDKYTRPDLRIYRIRYAGRKCGADALSRSNYDAILKMHGDEPWCAVDPDDGPLYVPGHLSENGQGHYDNTPPWDAAFDHAALVFHDGKVYVNLDYRFQDDPDDILAQSLNDLVNTLDSLDGYPVVDDEAFSELEYEEALESLEDTAKCDLPKKIKAQHAHGDEALELDPDFEITVDDIVSACRELDIDWENETQSDGKNSAVISEKDMKRIVEHLTPPWFKAACDGLEWADLGYPQPDENAPTSLPYPDPKDKETVRNWWIKER